MVKLENKVVLDWQGNNAISKTIYSMYFFRVVINDEESVASHVDFFFRVVEELEVFEKGHQFGCMWNLILVSMENKKRCTISQLITLKLSPTRISLFSIRSLIMHPQQPINVQFWRLFDLLVPSLKVVQH